MTKKRQILFSVIRGLLAILIALLVATLLIFCLLYTSPSPRD